MFPVPSGEAEAGPVATLAVFGASRIAEFLIALRTRPAVEAFAASLTTSSPFSTVQAASFLRTVWTTPGVVAHATLFVDVKMTVVRAVG